MLGLGKTAAGLLLLCGLVSAQDATPSDHEAITALAQQVKALQQTTSELREKVRILEAAQGIPSAPEAAASEAAPIPEQIASTTQSTPEAASSEHEVRGIQWRGFGEANYKVLDRKSVV